ncbi:MAG: hydroxylamine reductase [Syntrophomonadaceae bacterium]|jgi:hydroxylamine reductase
MYCNQCEQTSKGIACTSRGVCGKLPEVAALQDLLTYSVKGLSICAHEARQYGINLAETNLFIVKAMFATLTNVNFDPESLQGMIRTSAEQKQYLNDLLKQRGIDLPSTDPAVCFTPAENRSELLKQAEEIGFLIGQEKDPDIKSLQELTLYALRGISAYAYHAAILGQESDKIYDFIYETMIMLGNPGRSLQDWLETVLKAGEINLLAMHLLDAANTGNFGHPVPTEVPLGHRKGKCILVSGHDLKDMQALLEATKDSGITVYTHGEMLPAHGYPELKKYPHFFGHYGTAWQNQRKEFARFPGAILMTTNCIQEPAEDYLGRIFTAGPVAWPGATHLHDGSYEPVIKAALAAPGFASDEDQGTVMVGFARNTIMGVADQVVDAVKSGHIKHFFLVGGCDGAKAGRSYFSEFVEKTPSNTMVLTLGCGKFRFFDKKLGDIQGIPRLLDLGQCNDAYSAIQIAVALSEAFECGVNDLPLSLVISWYEQKAVSILCTLLYLGIKDIRLGPSLPAFVSPNVLDVLVKNYNIKPITTADQDLKAVLS